MTRFDDGLWERLVEEHGADLVSLPAPSRRHGRRPVVLGSGVAAVAAATAVTMIALGATATAPPAYALTQNPDGSITVTINDLTTAIPELNAKFAQMGIHETVVPVEANCPNTGNPINDLQLYPNETMSDSFTYTPGKNWLAPGFTGVLAAEQLPNGEVAIAIEAIKPPIPTCFPTTAYRDVQIGDQNGVPTITMQAVTTPAG